MGERRGVERERESAGREEQGETADTVRERERAGSEIGERKTNGKKGGRKAEHTRLVQ